MRILVLSAAGGLGRLLVEEALKRRHQVTALVRSPQKLAGLASRISVVQGEALDASAVDRFMPTYEVAERHHIRVAAPTAVTLAVAREVDLQASPVVRTIIRARELMLGATPDDRRHPRGLLAEVQSLGWGVLADIPGLEVVIGAVTKPWEPNVTSRSLPPDQFLAFNEPGYVKIAWTIRADPINATESVFRTETRAIATDSHARTKFRRYWVLPLARHYRHPVGDPRTCEKRGGTSCSPRRTCGPSRGSSRATLTGVSPTRYVDAVTLAFVGFARFCRALFRPDAAVYRSS